MGFGKSTILNFLDERINLEYDKKFKLAIVDVWRLSPQLLKQEFLEELNNKLKSISNEKIESELWHFKEEDFSSIPKIDFRIWETWKWLLFYGLLFAIPLSAGFLLNPLIEYDLITPTIILAIAIPIFLAMVTTLKEISKNAAKSGKKIIPRVESSFKFQELFKKIIKKYENKKLIIAIDNLDRYDDESVVNILNMIKTFLNEPNCIFIISCDKEAIIKHLKRHKGQFDTERDALEFLTKFFQLTLHIPSQIKGQLHLYAKKQLEIFSNEITFDPEVVDVFVAGITRNPRKIKQFVYNFVISHKLASIKEKNNLLYGKVITRNPRFLAKIIVLREEWPEFFRRLEENPSLLELMQHYIDTGNYDSSNEESMNGILDNNPGLEHFLKETSLTPLAQILPFIELHQESYESTISDIEKLILKVKQNDYDYVVQILSETKPEQQYHYILEITKLCAQYIRDKRIQVAFNSIDILTKIYDIVSEKSQKQIIKSLSTYMPRKEILDNAYKFDMNLLFPLILLMEQKQKEVLLQRYAEAINNYNNMSISLIQKFIECIDNIPETICVEVDYNLQLLGQQNHEIFLNCLDVLKINEKAAKKFVKEKALNALIDQTQSDKKDRVMNLYFELKHLANENNQTEFIKRISNPLKADKAPAMAAPSENIFNILRELNHNDFSQESADLLYSSIKRLSQQYADPTHKNIVVEMLLKPYLHYSQEIQTDFINQVFLPHITQQPPQNLPSVLEYARKEDAQILEYDTVIDNIFPILQNNPSESSIDFVLLCTPKEKWSKVSDKLLQLVKLNDLGKLQVFSSSYKNHFLKIPLEFRTKILEQLLSSSRQFNADQNLSVYTNLSITFEEIPENITDKFIDMFIPSIKSSEITPFQQGMTYLTNCFMYTSPDMMRDIFRLILLRFKDSLSPNLNLRTLAFNFLLQHNDQMNSEEEKSFIDLILEVLSDGKDIQHTLAILNSLEKIKLGNKKDQIYSLISDLGDSPNNDVKNKVKKIMEK
ncbi:MAG: hypothetical protein HRU07_05185 [Nitrosopumilus sp.]|nr:KAP family NTPase [Nitrosopumilus sp.]NRA05542.1 hypothetical protein [Nitrosopumilus sp.]